MERKLKVARFVDSCNTGICDYFCVSPSLVSFENVFATRLTFDWQTESSRWLSLMWVCLTQPFKGLNRTKG